MHKVVREDGTESNHCIRTAHAEQNAIAQSARVGAALEGSTLYCQMTPCYACAKMIITAGIERVVSRNDYHAGARSKEIFAEAGVAFELMNTKVEEYTNQ
jgi:dCMP deaminase